MMKRNIIFFTTFTLCLSLKSNAAEILNKETKTNPVEAKIVDKKIPTAIEVENNYITEKDNYINEIEKTIPDDEYEMQGDGSFPGLYINYGFNICGSNKNNGIKTTFLGSRFFDITLCYNLVIPDSHFAVVVGIGFSNKTLSFDGEKKIKKVKGKNKEVDHYKTLKSNKNDSTPEIEIVDTKEAMATDEKTITSFEGSYLNTYSWNFVLDFKYFVNKLYPKDSFVFSIGGKLSLLWKANTQIDYKQCGFSKSQSIWDKSNLKDVGYGVQARAAWSRFGVDYGIMLSNIYINNMGPKIEYLQQIGLSIDLF